MLTETLLLATTRTPTDNVDAPSISLYNLHTSTLTTSLKRSQTSSSGLAITKTHIFAQQSDKPVINIYSLSTSLLETSVSFPEPFTVLSASPCGLYLAAGTATGRVYIWELASARFVATPPLHLQKITALAWNRTGAILAVGSEDTNVSIWSVAALLDTRQVAREPLRVLDRHIHAVTALAIGPAGSGPSELLVTAGRDKNVICWELHTGTHLRTYMIQGVPLCLAMDPAERAVYTGLEEGGVQMVEFQATQSGKSDMYEGEFRDMPVQVTGEVWGGGAKVLTAQVGYEGNVLVTGDEKGECAVWDVASGGMVKSLCQMKAPLSNLLILPPTGFATTAEPTITVPTLPKPKYESILAASSSTTYDPSSYTLTISLPTSTPETTTSSLSTSSFTTSSRSTFGPENDMEEILKGAREMKAVKPALAGKQKVEALEAELAGLYQSYERLAEVQKKTWQGMVELAGEKE